MMEDVVPRLRELTNVDFERDSTNSESELSPLCSLLSQFMENEARSCSMDIGGITPLYVYRMWGGDVSLEDITQGLTELRKQGFIG